MTIYNQNICRSLLLSSRSSNQLAFRALVLKLRKRSKPKKSRNRFDTAVDYSESIWMKMLADQSVADPTSALGKKFRKRFRVPYPVFIELMTMAEELGFEKRPVDCCVLWPCWSATGAEAVRFASSARPRDLL